MIECNNWDITSNYAVFNLNRAKTKEELKSIIIPAENVLYFEDIIE